MDRAFVFGLMLLAVPGLSFLWVPTPAWALRTANQVGAPFFWPFAIMAMVLVLLAQLYLAARCLFPKAMVAPIRKLCVQLAELIQELAPLLGFFGTLVGLIIAFEQLGAGSDVMDLVGAMGIAMATSLIGVAISAAAYSFRFIARTLCSPE